MMHEEKPGWKKRALDELRNLSITVMYIWVLLSVFTLHREIVLANYHINYSAKFGFAFINAVILAKFMWLGEVLHAEKKAVGKALLYSNLHADTPRSCPALLPGGQDECGPAPLELSAASDTGLGTATQVSSISTAPRSGSRGTRSPVPSAFTSKRKDSAR
jgi:hypothetical protein